VAALPTPLGRRVLLSHLWERVRLPDRTVVVLSAEERMGARELDGARKLVEFRLEDGLPVWLYDLGGRAASLRPGAWPRSCARGSRLTASREREGTVVRLDLFASRRSSII